MVMERKFIHSCGSVGRLEDVVVSDQYRYVPEIIHSFLLKCSLIPTQRKAAWQTCCVSSLRAGSEAGLLQGDSQLC